jgi:hypothetical protein
MTIKIQQIIGNITQENWIDKSNRYEENQTDEERIKIIQTCGNFPMLKTYGPPRLQKVLSRSAADQSASTYPASEVSSRPRWRCARPGPHKTPPRRAPLSTPGFLSAV